MNFYVLASRQVGGNLNAFSKKRAEKITVIENSWEMRSSARERGIDGFENRPHPDKSLEASHPVSIVTSVTPNFLKTEETVDI